MTKILLIDDDVDLIKTLSINFRISGYEVATAANGSDGLRAAYNFHPDVIILDVIMPEGDGFETCAQLRKLTDVPILMLTACSSESDVVRGLQVGADDYMVKPFSQAVLEAHIRALMRRRNNNHLLGEHSNHKYYEDKDLVIDLEAQWISCSGNQTRLTPVERKILGILLDSCGRVVSHQHLIREIWGSYHEELRENLAVYISMLRKKCFCQNHQYIQSQWGVGYIFVPNNHLAIKKK